VFVYCSTDSVVTSCCVWVRDVTRLDGAQGKKQVWRPMFEPEVFLKQMYCTDESTCDKKESTCNIVEIFRRPRSHSAPREIYSPLVPFVRPWSGLFQEHQCRCEGSFN